MKTPFSLVCVAALIAAGCSDEKKPVQSAYGAPHEERTNATRTETTVTTMPNKPSRTAADDAQERDWSATPEPDHSTPQNPQKTSDPLQVAPAGTYGANAPDNTGVNRRDRDGDTMTPMDQGSSEADRAITAEIRKAVVADGTLSFSAKNVKIITKDGNVVLRGPVKNEDERAAIQAKAARVAGASRVTNQLEIAK